MSHDSNLERYRRLPEGVIVPTEAPAPPAVRVRVSDLYEALLADAKTENTRLSRIVAIGAFSHYLQVGTPQEAIAMFLRSGRGPANAISLGFRKHEVARGMSAATINARHACLRRLVKLANRYDVIGFTVEIDDLKNFAHADRRGPGADGWRAIWEVAVSWGDGKSGCLTRALIRLLHDNALRKMECVSLDLEHVDLSRPGVFILGKGQGQAREWVTLNGPTTEALRAWVAIRGPEPGALFTLRESRPASYLPFAPRVAQWRSEDRSNAEIARLLSAEGVPSPAQRRWDATLVGHIFWEVYPRYVPLVPLVEQLVREGRSNAEVARRLNAEGHRRRGGVPWEGDAVCDIFGTAAMRNPEKSPADFVRPAPARIHDKWVNRLIDKLAREAGLTAKVRPHGLRHAGVTRALDLTNGDIRKAQRFARHTDPKTTMRYDDDRTDVAGEVANLIGDDF